MRVEVAYALPERQAIRVIELPEGATVAEAIERSGLAAEFPQIDLARDRVGIFGKLTHLDARLRSGDRVEIYRPLAVEPMEARRARAKAAGAK